jgi:hypothetical protein
LAASAVQANGWPNRHLTEVILKARCVRELPPPFLAMTAASDGTILMRARQLMEEACQYCMQQFPSVIEDSHFAPARCLSSSEPNQQVTNHPQERTSSLLGGVCHERCPLFSELDHGF